jgi:hypothetical protein
LDCLHADSGRRVCAAALEPAVNTCDLLSVCVHVCIWV